MDAHATPAGRGRPFPLSPAQIVAIGLVTASMGWSAWLLAERPPADEVALLEDTVLDAGQLAAIEAALDRASLTDYRTESGRVWVPRARQSAYKRAVVDADAIPKPWGTRFHEALESGGVWTTPAARSESLRVALQDELASVLCSMPGIERAAVLYDEEEDAGFRQERRRTASVGVRTSAGVELDADRARGIRVLVASAIAGLTPEQVAVTDLATGRVFAGKMPAESEPHDPVLARSKALETTLAARVRQAVSFVEDATVDVAVDVAPPDGDTAGSAGERRPPAAAANAPAEVGAAPVAEPAAATPPSPRSIHVTVAVPDRHLRAAVAAARDRRGGTPDAVADEEAERAEVAMLREVVARALPSVVDPRRCHVLVTPFATVPEPAGDGRPAEVAVAPSDSLPSAAAGPAHEHGPPIPRAWLAAASMVAGVVAGAAWWAATRDRAAESDARRHRVAERERRAAA